MDFETDKTCEYCNNKKFGYKIVSEQELEYFIMKII